MIGAPVGDRDCRQPGVPALRPVLAVERLRSMTLTPSARPRQHLQRLRSLLWPILETAAAAVAAWYLAKLLLGERETGFAPIATLVCLGATIGQQRDRAFELIGGGVLGVLIADLL